MNNFKLISILFIILNILVFSCSEQRTPDDKKLFIVTVKTDNNGDSDDNQFRLSMFGEGYDFNIDWGDEQIETHVENSKTDQHYLIHTYETAGTYKIKISGSFPRIYFESSTGDAKKLIEINQWGNIKWKSFNHAFYSCSEMLMLARDVPDLSHVTDMDHAFCIAKKFNQDISTWDVSNVIHMSGMFCYTPFNQDISGWDVSNVTDMAGMFSHATAFNKNISAWDVSNVTNMSYMFDNADAFNQNIAAWDVSNVQYMSKMFRNITRYSNLFKYIRCVGQINRQRQCYI